jgi:hypothetical protein
MRPVLDARTEAEIDAIFAHLGKRVTAGAVVGTDSLLLCPSPASAAAAAYRVPTIYYAREFRDRRRADEL